MCVCSAQRVFSYEVVIVFIEFAYPVNSQRAHHMSQPVLCAPVSLRMISPP